MFNMNFGNIELLHQRYNDKLKELEDVIKTMKIIYENLEKNLPKFPRHFYRRIQNRL